MSGTTLISVQVLRERKQTEGKHDFQPKAPLCVGGLGAQLYTGLFASGTAYEQAVLQMGVQVQPILRPEHFPFVHRIQPATKRRLERAVQKMHNGAMMAELLANSRLSPTKREGRRMQEQQKHILFHSERQ